VATLAHPLNRAEFDERTGRLVAGYTVLQPRIEVTPLSAEASWFAHVFVGDGGLDLYGRAVSDAYQDLFDEGIYVGKGIYDPVAFEQSLRGRVPENALLSHDLFEGVHGRTALVSEVVLMEDYPPDYITHARRLHRWARGDWQLLPWLGRHVPLEGGGRGPNPLSLVARWKIVGNLRRTLLAPTLLGFLLVAWLGLPGSPIVWTAIALLALAAPTLTETADGLLSTRILVAPSQTFRSVMARARRSIALWALHTVFLAHRSVVMSDAIVRTLFRLAVSRRRLLQWTSAAATARVLGGRTSKRRLWREMTTAPLLAVAATILLVLLRPAAFPVALPLMLVWLVSPEVAARASQPRRRKTEPLADEDVRHLRVLARRTWAFFDTFVGPADQWLPPDHFQETPRGGGPPHFPDQHRAPPARNPRGPRPRLCGPALRRAPLEEHLRHARPDGAPPRPLLQLVRHPRPRAAPAALRLDGGQREPRGLSRRREARLPRAVSAAVVAPQRWDGLVDTVDVLAEVIAQATQRQLRDSSLAGCVDGSAEAMTLKTQQGAWGAGVVRLLERACPEVERRCSRRSRPE
jgi:cyclic beta-1,2-glucan synthetase